MRDFSIDLVWAKLQMACAAIGGWLGYFLGGMDGLLTALIIFMVLDYSPFEFYIKRKLFLHNGGHALCAYLGYEKGCEYIWQAIADPEIYEAARASMMASAQALVEKFGEGVRMNVESNIADLLFRFQNRALKDTVARVGADPVRKLRRNDRIVGAALFAIEQGVDPAPIVRGIVAALKFDRAEDNAAQEIQTALKEKGIEYVLGYSG